MPNCAVQGCKSRAIDSFGEKIKFYRFPLVRQRTYSLKEISKRRQKAWYKALRLRTTIDPKNLKVCGKHFISGKCADLNDETNPDWIPTQNLKNPLHFPSPLTVSRQKDYRYVGDDEKYDYDADDNGDGDNNIQFGSDDDAAVAGKCDDDNAKYSNEDEVTDDIDNGSDIENESIQDDGDYDKDNDDAVAVYYHIECASSDEDKVAVNNDNHFGSNIKNELNPDEDDAAAHKKNESNPNDDDRDDDKDNNDDDDGSAATYCDIEYESNPNDDDRDDDKDNNVDDDDFAATYCDIEYANYSDEDAVTVDNENHFDSDMKDKNTCSQNENYVDHDNDIEMVDQDGFTNNQNKNSQNDDICQCRSNKKFVDAGVQTEISSSDLDNDIFLLNTVQNELIELKAKYESQSTNLNCFKDDDIKTRFFTGLASFQHLKSLYKKLDPDLPQCKNKLSKFDILFIVLFRLRLCLPYIYFAFKFNVSRQTISKYFKIGLWIMYSKLQPMVYWPSRTIVKSTMPAKFQEQFGDKISVIIDCFEVFIENSSNVEAAAQTFSNYKHGNTAKVLIASLPQGHICFISSGYGGRSSDKFVTENSGFLNHLEIGDVVMADRGFLITDAVKDHGASIIMPAFTKGKSQLHPLDVAVSRQIASLRIDVERVIGQLRIKYTILNQRKLNVFNFGINNGVCIFDQIVTVCCALINLCPSIIIANEEFWLDEDET